MAVDKRYIDLEGTFNFRDIGGYQGKDGRIVKFGHHYRADELSKLTQKDVAKIETLGINTIIDYRNERERFQNEDVWIPNTTLYYLDPVADIAALASSESNEKVSEKFDMKKISAAQANFMMSEQNRVFVESKQSREAYRKMFDLILNEENIIVQHCRGGKDRTGYGVALILLLLGVSRENVIKDYLLTNHYKHDKNERSLATLLEETKDEDYVQAVRYFKEAHEHFLDIALDEIDQRYNGIESYVMKELGLSLQQIERIREILLEK